MVWSSTSPEGSLSVATNVPIQLANTAYTEATLNLDHYWNIGAGEDGHHKWVQNVATNIADPTVATNATLANGLDSVYYSRFKVEAESTNNRDCQPFFINETGVGPTTNIMQLLGIRACAVFNVVSSAITTTPYSHNISGIVRNSTGDYTLTYSQALPSADYLVFSSGIRDSSGGTFIQANVKGSSTPSQYKTTTNCTIQTETNNANLVDPLQVWFVCFGG